MVSIHAPARGATPHFWPAAMNSESFQSTRPHGARQGYARTKARLWWFQSTRPHGARPVSVLHYREWL